jgi:hypothetical protein
MQALGGMMAAGQKPNIPEWPDFQRAQQTAIQGNLDAFGSASDLTARTNQFNQDELNARLRQAIPGYDQMVSNASRNINSQLAGEIPRDVAMQINRRSAATSLAGGYGGSGMARNLEARDLGLTSYGIQQQGLSSAMQWIGNSRQYRMPSVMDVTSMFVTPGQQGEWMQGRFQRDLLAAGVEAMPDPRRAAIGNAGIQQGASL